MTDAKSQLVLSWLTKAQNDLASAQILAASVPPLLDTALYHCQQAAEKSVKGYLVFHDHEVNRIHDLEILIRSAMKCDNKFSNWIDVGIQMTPYATIYRYPGYLTEPTQEQFKQALSGAKALFNFVLTLLPEEMQPG